MSTVERFQEKLRRATESQRMLKNLAEIIHHQMGTLSMDMDCLTLSSEQWFERSVSDDESEQDELMNTIREHAEEAMAENEARAAGKRRMDSFQEAKKIHSEVKSLVKENQEINSRAGITNKQIRDAWEPQFDGPIPEEYLNDDDVKPVHASGYRPYSRWRAEEIKNRPHTPQASFAELNPKTYRGEESLGPITEAMKSKFNFGTLPGVEIVRPTAEMTNLADKMFTKVTISGQEQEMIDLSDEETLESIVEDERNNGFFQPLREI